MDNCHDINLFEKEFVIQEVASAGFILDQGSSMLENPEDD